jgi:hypothetical protein
MTNIQHEVLLALEGGGYAKGDCAPNPRTEIRQGAPMMASCERATLEAVDGGECAGDYLIEIENVFPFDICLIPWRRA